MNFNSSFSIMLCSKCNGFADRFYDPHLVSAGLIFCSWSPKLEITKWYDEITKYALAKHTVINIHSFPHSHTFIGRLLLYVYESRFPRELESQAFSSTMENTRLRSVNHWRLNTHKI